MKTLVSLLFTFSVTGSFACINCSKPLQRALAESTSFPGLPAILSAFFVLAVIVVILVLVAGRNHRLRQARYPGAVLADPVPLLNASVIIGIGSGGFTDGILLHQVLQWHEMLSNKIPVTSLTAKSVNMFWDGIFHLFCLLVLMTGVVLLWKLLGKKNVHRSGRLFAGGLLLGWGVFNIVEGVIDHHILKLHNVREFSPNPDFWNYLFLGISLVLLIVGAVLVRSAGKISRTGE